MARRKIESRNVRSLTKTSRGRAYSITLPVDVIRKFRWQMRQKLELESDYQKKQVIIKEWKR